MTTIRKIYMSPDTAGFSFWSALLRWQSKDTLAVLIEDVSGKGVPAALFMAIVKMQIKNNAQYSLGSKEVF
jgi:hypothetical protein